MGVTQVLQFELEIEKREGEVGVARDGVSRGNGRIVGQFILKFLSLNT